MRKLQADGRESRPNVAGAPQRRPATAPGRPDQPLSTASVFARATEPRLSKVNGAGSGSPRGHRRTVGFSPAATGGPTNRTGRSPGHDLAAGSMPGRESRRRRQRRGRHCLLPSRLRAASRWQPGRLQCSGARGVTGGAEERPDARVCCSQLRLQAANTTASAMPATTSSTTC